MPRLIFTRYTMDLKFFLYRTRLLTDIRFDDLRDSFKRKIGLRFLKGNIQPDFISLFYLFDSNMYRKMELQRIPIMQFTIDREETIDGQQVIRFKRANFSSAVIFLVVSGLNIVPLFVEPISFEYGLIVSFIYYIITLGVYNQQLGKFKEELKLISKELSENKN